MFRVLIIAFAALLATTLPAIAQTPESTTQMQLPKSTTFIDRVIYNGVQVMKEVLEEPSTASASAPIPAYTAACHTRRAAYAQSFLLSTDAFARQAATLIVGANFSGVVITGSVVNRAVDPDPLDEITPAPIWDSSVADTVLRQAFRIYMNTFAGCIIFAGS